MGIVNSYVPERPNGLFLIGEAPGEAEDKEGKPFMGRAGSLLNTCLEEAGLVRDECYVCNVFSERPPNNSVKHYFVTAKKARISRIDVVKPAWNGLYLIKHRKWELQRVQQEIVKARPKVVVTLGSVALWALRGYSGRLGEAVERCVADDAMYWFKPAWHDTDIGFIAAYHPAYVLRNMRQRDVLVASLKLAKAFISA